MTSAFDVVIVGAGLAGLETGALLAHGGARVLVLERGNDIGGRAKVVEQEGFTLNYGLHYMMEGFQNPHYRILNHIGQTHAVNFAAVDPRLMWRLKAGSLHLVPASLSQMMTTTLLTMRGKLGLIRAMINLFSTDPEQFWDVALGEWLDDVAPESSLRQFMLDTAGPIIFDPDPSKISAGHFIREMRSLLSLKGPLAIYPEGGWNAISQVLCRFIETHSGEVRAKSPVDDIIFENEQVHAVRSKGETIQVQTVILAVPPAQLTPLLQQTPVQGISPEKIEPTMGVAVDIGFKGITNTTIGTIEMPDIQATSGFHNLFMPSLAPSDGVLFQGLRWLSPEQMADKNEVKQTEHLFLQQLERIWPDIRQKIVTRRVLVRDVVMSAHR